VSTGKSAKTVREYLEKHYKEEAVATRQDTLKLAVKSLSEVVQSGAQNIEIAVMARDPTKKSGVEYQILPVAEVEKLLQEVERENEQEAAQQQPPAR